jgi:hypothetical protein
MFNIEGRRVALLANRNFGAGHHAVIWDAADQPAGMYFCRADVGGEVMIRRVMLVE